MANLKYEIKNKRYKVLGDEKEQFIIYEITEDVLSDAKMKGVYNNYLQLLAYDQDIAYAKAYID